MNHSSYKILHVIPSISLKHGGPTEAVFGMVGALRELGTDAQILSTDDNDGGRLAVPLNQWISYKSNPVYFVRRVASDQHTLAGFTFAPAIVRTLWCEIPRFNFIHIHTVFSFPAIVAMLIARLRNRPYAVRPMGHLNVWSLGVRRRIKDLQLRLVTRRKLDSAAFLHATSAVEASDAEALGLRCPIKVIPLGITPPDLVKDAGERLRERLSIDASKTVALFLSRIHQKKGLEFLLRAMSDAALQNIHLVIAGDGESSYVASIRQLVEGLGLAGRVHGLGFLQGQEKWEVAQGCDLFVLPSYSENFGLAVLEALACGLFVIVSPEVGISRDVSQPGIGCTAPRDATALARIVAECEASESFDASARAERRAFVERRFSWKSTATQLIAAYKEALDHAS